MIKAIAIAEVLCFLTGLCLLVGMAGDDYPYDDRTQATGVWVDLYDLPQEAFYVDILVKINESDEVFTSFNKDNALKNGFSENDGYIGYSYEDFISYSLHFKNADTDMKLETSNGSSLHNRLIYNSYSPNDNFSLLFKYSSEIRVALLDADKNVINVSDIQDLKQGDYCAGEIQYNVDSRIYLRDGLSTKGNLFANYLLIYAPFGAVLAVIMFLIGSSVSSVKRHFFLKSLHRRTEKIRSEIEQCK